MTQRERDIAEVEARLQRLCDALVRFWVRRGSGVFGPPINRDNLSQAFWSIVVRALLLEQYDLAHSASQLARAWRPVDRPAGPAH